MLGQVNEFGNVTDFDAAEGLDQTGQILLQQIRFQRGKVFLVLLIYLITNFSTNLNDLIIGQLGLILLDGIVELMDVARL